MFDTNIINTLSDTIKRSKQPSSTDKEERIVLNEAAKALKVKKQHVSFFKEKDSFNPGNTIVGAFCDQPGLMFGSLYIASVNNKFVPQKIFSYPSIGNLDSETTPYFKYIAVREKFEGFSVLGYKYTDGKKDFVTFKPRITEVLRNTVGFPAVSLWDKILKMYPHIPDAIMDNINMVFEVFGYQVFSCIQYNFDLDVSTLFAVRAIDGQLFEMGGSKGHLPTIPANEFDCADIVTFPRMIASMENFMDNLNRSSVKQNINIGTAGYCCYAYGEKGKLLIYSFLSRQLRQTEEVYINKHMIARSITKQLASGFVVDTKYIMKVLSENFDPGKIYRAETLIGWTIKGYENQKDFTAEVLNWAIKSKLNFNNPKERPIMMAQAREKWEDEKMLDIWKVLKANLLEIQSVKRTAISETTNDTKEISETGEQLKAI